MLAVGLIAAMAPAWLGSGGAGGHALAETAAPAAEDADAVAADDAAADNGADQADTPAQAPTPAPPTAAPPGTGTALPSGADVAIIRIEDMIYGFTFDSLQRRVERAIDQGASVIVIELNTPGGQVNTALDIAKYIKALNVPTVAWVNNEAYSAGILIASACDQIVMSPASATGDAAPIMPGQEMGPTERAKILSPILEEFRDNARANNYDYALFHAMVVLGVEVFHVEHPDTGERRLVNQADYQVKVRGLSIDEANAHVRDDVDGADRQLDIAVPSVEVATDEDRGQWELLRQVHDGRTLLTLHQDRALEIGLSRATVRNDRELQQHLQANTAFRVDETWSESLAGFLVHPMVRGILVLALLLGAYIEFQTPGVGIAGAVAGLALITLLGAPFLVGLAEIWHILVFFIGLALLLVELAFLPGFGFLGVGGLALMFVSLVLTGIPTGGGNVPGLPPVEMWDRMLLSGLYIMFGALGGIFGIYFVAKHFGRVPVLNRLVLEYNQPAALAGAGAPAAAGGGGGGEIIYTASGDETLGEGRIKVGDVGIVTTGLRPSGRAEFDGQIVDVVSHGQWIAPGQQVRVVEIHGNRIVVDEPETP